MLLKKLAPKNFRICPGCPPKEIKPLAVPRFSMGNPVMADDANRNADIQVLKAAEKPKHNRNGAYATLF